MFGGNFGHESELRDANRHPSGRRHQPREITSDNGVPNFYDTLATQQHELDMRRRAQQEQNANVGPSFMEKMYGHDKNDGNHLISVSRDGGHGEVFSQKGSRGNAPHDHLNLFEWNSGPAQIAQGNNNTNSNNNNNNNIQSNNHEGKRFSANARQGRRSIPSESQLREIYPAQDAESLRTHESHKFESNANGVFLQFDEYHSGPERRTGIAIRQRNSGGGGAGGANNNNNNNNNIISNNNRAAHGTSEHGMMDSLIRDDGGYKRQMKRPGPEIPKKEGPPIEGFPGMGQNSEHKPFEHITRKVIQSSIFPPSIDAYNGQAEFYDANNENKNNNNNVYDYDNGNNVNNNVYSNQDNGGHNARHRSQPQRAHPQFCNDQATNAVYNYNPAKGIVPEVYNFDGNGNLQDRESYGAEANPEWLQETQLSNYQTGIAPAENIQVSPQGKKHVDFDKMHEEVESVNPQRRTMLYKMRNQAAE